jgi:hypothetical protein
VIPASFTGGWTTRLRSIFGTPLADVGEQDLEALVDHEVREDADLDFKQALYGNGDSDRREFAADVAALWNDRGRVIVIGVREENDVAVERTPVEMDAAEEGRMRSIGASNIVPYAPFYIRPVPSDETPGRGYYRILVPPSPDRPHAVRKGIDLRYPLREHVGADKRWLSESEIADAYRDRFTRVGSDAARVEAVMT